MFDFFDREFLKDKCIRTFIQNYDEESSEFEGKIFSEGCYMMEIINQSETMQLHLTFGSNADQIILYPTLIPNIYDKIVLPGHPAIVRSDIINYEWEFNTPSDMYFIVIRHMVVDYEEGVDYPVQKIK